MESEPNQWTSSSTSTVLTISRLRPVSKRNCLFTFHRDGLIVNKVGCCTLRRYWCLFIIWLWLFLEIDGAYCKVLQLWGTLFCAFAIFTFVINNGKSNASTVLKRVGTFAESEMLIPLQRGAHCFLSESVLYAVMQGCQYNYVKAHTAYDSSLDSNWSCNGCSRWYSCMPANSKELEICFEEFTTREKHSLMYKANSVSDFSYTVISSPTKDNALSTRGSF